MFFKHNKSYGHDGIVIMENLKLNRILTTLFLLLIFCTSSVYADACFCGNTCFNGFSPVSKKKTNILFHMRCMGNLCKSCNLENGQMLKAPNTKTQMFNIKIFYAEFILFSHLDYTSIYHAIEDFDSFYTFKTIVSPPIYLQNLSILC